MSIGLQMLAATGILIGVSAPYWLTLWQVYRIRRFCPACTESALHFVIGHRPTRTAYFECRSCRAHVRAEISFLELALNSFGIRLRKREYNFAEISEQEWREFFRR